MIADLSAPELFVWKWQMEEHGHFYTDLAQLINRADKCNRDLLRKAYPDAVEGITQYKEESRWWENVQRRVKKGKGTFKEKPQ